MEQHFIATIAVRVMSVQYRGVLIGLEAPALRFFRSQKPTQLGDLFDRPLRAFATYSVYQGFITEEQVVTGERRHLIQGLLRGRLGNWEGSLHVPIICPHGATNNRHHIRRVMRVTEGTATS